MICPPQGPLLMAQRKFFLYESPPQHYYHEPRTIKIKGIMIHIAEMLRCRNLMLRDTPCFEFGKIDTGVREVAGAQGPSTTQYPPPPAPPMLDRHLTPSSFHCLLLVLLPVDETISITTTYRILKHCLIADPRSTKCYCGRQST